MSMKEFKELIGNPSTLHSARQPDGRWEQIELELGIKFPAEYKEFIDDLGAGRVGDFISVFSPFSSNENLNLRKQLRRQTEVMNELEISGEKLPYRMFPADEGILPVGMTDNGDVIFLKLEKTVWPVVINDGRGPEWERFDDSLVDFFVGIFSGVIKSSILPDLSSRRPISFTQIS